MASDQIKKCDCGFNSFTQAARCPQCNKMFVGIELLKPKPVTGGLTAHEFYDQYEYKLDR